ncbi:MAG: 4'-phosphopantetheinyl transferase superfamily protein [Gemmatimonadota bacterium]|nr:4'-phosphopantetheinyl transferase superfamily protein [Gemmatimonadota bacterium]
MSDRWHAALDWRPGPDDVIDIWRLNLTFHEEDWSLLSADETENAKRLIIEKKRHQKVSARAHLRRILARYVDADSKRLIFEYGIHGKPRLADYEEPHFNLSHSHGIGLVAVTQGVRIGVDVEYRQEDRIFTEIANRFFSETENSGFNQLPPDERTTAFYQTWVRKEAYLKAWGTGLSFSSNRFTLDNVGNPAECLVSTEMPGDNPADWHFEDIDLVADYVSAICFEGVGRPLRYWKT